MTRVRTIDGKKYHAYGCVHRKDMARMTAESFRREGYCARVVKKDSGYWIYTRPEMGNIC